MIQVRVVSKTIFKRVFESMHLSFKKPSGDTCSKCDSINMKLKYASADHATNLKEILKKHEEASKVAYAEKRTDKVLAESSKYVAIVIFDLQQCLPTPYLQTSETFYKRQLWTFNLAIHDLKTRRLSVTCDRSVKATEELMTSLHVYTISSWIVYKTYTQTLGG